MTLFVQDVFAEAKDRGLTDQFVGTFADLKQALRDLEDFVTVPSAAPGGAPATMPVVGRSFTAGGAEYVQVQWGDGRYQWLKPGQFTREDA